MFFFAIFMMNMLTRLNYLIIIKTSNNEICKNPQTNNTNRSCSIQWLFGFKCIDSNGATEAFRIENKLEIR